MALRISHISTSRGRPPDRGWNQVVEQFVGWVSSCWDKLYSCRSLGAVYLHYSQLTPSELFYQSTFQTSSKRLALLTAYLDDRPIYLFDEWASDQDPLFRRSLQRSTPNIETKWYWSSAMMIASSSADRMVGGLWQLEPV